MSKPAILSTKILDGAVSLYRRKSSPMYQCCFVADGVLIRASTKKRDFEEAKQVATDFYLQAKFREREGLTAVTKSFSSVAQLAKKSLSEAIAAGHGKKIYKDYIEVIDRYLIPFFGKRHVDNIDYKAVNEFAAWRLTLFNGKTPAASTITTHNSALNRVFDLALERGFITKSQIPVLRNDGAKGVARPDFTLDEYTQLYQFMRSWVMRGKEGLIRQKRELLRDYVLVLANTGMRHGTESYGIKWKHIRFITHRGERRLMISVSGKTGQRELVARNNTVEYLMRIQKRTTAIANENFEELLQRGYDEYVFVLPDGTRCTTLASTFKVLMQDSGLLVDRRTGLERTLYSLRHMYATLAILRGETTLAKLAAQMGTSAGLLDTQYKHIIPQMSASEHGGKVYAPKPKKGKNNEVIEQDAQAIFEQQQLELEKAIDELLRQGNKEGKLMLAELDGGESNGEG